MRARRFGRWSRGSTLARCTLVTVLVLAAAACGDDGDDAGDGAAEDAVAASDEADDGATTMSGDCAGTDLSFTNLTTGESVAITSTAASSGHGGAVYVAYAADFDLDEDSLSSFFPDVPDGNNLIVVQTTVFNAVDELEPLEPGTEISWAAGDEQDQHAFMVAHRTSDESFDSASADATTGILTVTGVGDVFCGEVDYVDADKELSGTFEAPVLREI